MQRTPIAVLGASGYSGIEATRLLAQHPRAELKVVASDRWQGETVERRAGVRGPAGRLRYASPERALELARECAAALLCTPVDASLQLAPALLAAGLKVVDLSGAFRLADAGAFRTAYGLDHPHPGLVRESVYGMPELGGREAIAKARLIANPGCYPTAAALALAPLLRAGVLAAGDVIVDAASGTTGAGRKASEEMSFSEVVDDFRAYRVLRHQHTPEIAQALFRAAGGEVPLTFTPHLLPLRRDDFLENRVQPARNSPVGIIFLEFSQVRDIADVIALSRFVHILPRQFLSAHLLDALDGFQHRDAVFASAAEVINLAGPRIRRKLFDRAHHVIAVDVVAHLLALVAKNRVRAAAQSNLN